MSGFSADWLALREAADTTARADLVLSAAQRHFTAFDRDVLSVCDLGSGTGASVAAFAPVLPPRQSWCLVDHDAENLERAQARYTGANAITGVSVATRVHDLSREPAPWDATTHLVTATALFDLTSASWLEKFAARLAGDCLPLLTTLTYDGRHMLAPEHPFDGEMMDAFNAHQGGDKGFGPAAGPTAIKCLTDALSAHGYEIATADSSWHLDGKRDHALIKELLNGWVNAVVERNLVSEETAHTWHDARMKDTTSLQVGHQDVFAVPARQ